VDLGLLRGALLPERVDPRLGRRALHGVGDLLGRAVQRLP
jgi:hypothetical protein